MKLLPCACAITFIAALASADTGQIRAHLEDGPFQLTVFTEPTPVRVGVVDLSALVLDPSGDALPDTVVLAQLIPPEGPPLHVTLDSEQATAAFMRAATFTLDHAGTWKVEVVASNGTDQVRSAFALPVAEPLPALLELWPWLIPVPIALGLWLLTGRRAATVHAS